MRNLTATNMCTTYCPCPSDLDISKWNETLLNQNNRTLYINSSLYPAYQPMTLADVNSTLDYQNFWDCYQNISQKYQSLQNIGGGSYTKYIDTISSGVQELIRTLENELKCEGICKQGAFYYFRSIYEGPPLGNCLTEIKNSFQTKPLAIGILLLVSFFLTFLSFITTYSLCYAGQEKKPTPNGRYN